MHWFKGRNFVENPYPINEVLKLMDESRLEKIVVIALNYETNEKYGGFKIPNELISDMVKAHPDRFYGVAAVDPNKGVLAVRELEVALRDLGLKGLKVLPNRAEMYPNDKRLYPFYEKCLEYDVPVWVHIGYHPQPLTPSKYSDPMTLDDVAIDFPDLTIIGNHIGFPYTEVMIANCLKHQNVYVDTAAWSPKGLPDIFIKYMNGPLRYKVLYGTDWCLLSWEKTIR
jgi:predicted TIM-barrel fold metal-dependent hydrolase